MPGADVHHAVQSMPLAVHRCFAAIGIEKRMTLAGAVQATFGAYVHHAVCSMLFAERRNLVALEIEARSSHAGIM